MFILLLIVNIRVFAQTEGAAVSEKEKVKVSKSEKLRFSELLKTKNSGIYKLINNPCGDDEKIIDAENEFCLTRKGVSFGSHFSFYSNVHYEKFSHLAYPSISFIKGEIIAKNNQRLVQVLVELDKTKLETVNDSDQEIKDLLEFPLKNEDELKKLKPINGKYNFRQLQITDKINPDPNKSYALRSVFLDTFNSLKFSRKETVFVFQIAEKENGTLLIVWRKLLSRSG